ncbi:MAG: permease-like cell division protein FtsX [Clostridia bacterium]|nr:permease-like cell division protein FtsX [Clostridia bacterium]
MKYNVVSYLIGEGFRNVLKNKKSTISAITVMFLCMIIFGVFFILGENINHIMNTVEEAQGVQVYFKVGTKEERMKEVGEQIKNIDGVNNVQFVSKEEGMNELKESYKDNASALEGMSSDFLPDSYRVTLSKLELNEQIQEQITAIVGEDLDEIKSSNETISTIMKIGNGIRIFTFVLLIILILFAVVIISNTIKLTVHARRKEISIMKYVGATNSFIRGPFIVEGILIGLISALIAILIVGFIYNGMIPNLEQSEIVKKLEITFVTFTDMFRLLIAVYLVLGIGIGVIGSSISMRKYLEV